MAALQRGDIGTILKTFVQICRARRPLVARLDAGDGRLVIDALFWREEPHGRDVGIAANKRKGFPIYLRAHIAVIALFDERGNAEVVLNDEAAGDSAPKLLIRPEAGRQPRPEPKSSSDTQKKCGRESQRKELQSAHRRRLSISLRRPLRNQAAEGRLIKEISALAPEDVRRVRPAFYAWYIRARRSRRIPAPRSPWRPA